MHFMIQEIWLKVSALVLQISLDGCNDLMHLFIYFFFLCPLYLSVFVGAAAGTFSPGIRTERQEKKRHHHCLRLQWHHVHHQTPHADSFCRRKLGFSELYYTLVMPFKIKILPLWQSWMFRLQEAAPPTWWASPTSMPSTNSSTTWSWSARFTAPSLVHKKKLSSPKVLLITSWISAISWI